jgi:hypothetical protein
MGRKIHNNLNTREVVAILEKVEIDLTHLVNLIKLNLGKDVVKYRRASSLVGKVSELIEIFEEDEK